MFIFFPLWHFFHECEPLTGRLQLLYMKFIHPHIIRAQILMENYWFYCGWKEISLHTLVTNKTHTVHFTIYVLDQHQSLLSLHSVHCDSVSSQIDGNKIILPCCILPTHKCKPRGLGVKNTNLCVQHQKGNHLPSLYMLHHCSCFTECHEMVSRWFYCGWMETLELYILRNNTTNTHTYIYTPHFTILHITSLVRLSS
jgi:hypothetical protein